MYDATIVNDSGEALRLGFDTGFIFDINPLSGVDVEISTSQSFQQIGESVDGVSTIGLTREISGVIFKYEKENHNKLLSVLAPLSSGRIFVKDKYCRFYVNKSPYIFKSKTGKIIFEAEIYCAYPFWVNSITTQYMFGGVTPSFMFPLYYNEHKFGTISPVEIKNCRNNGNVKQYFEAVFSTISTVSNFGFKNKNTGKFVQISETLTQNDKVRIHHENGQIKIVFERDGVEKNIINKLVDGSTLFELEPGDNLLIPFADENPENLVAYISFNQAYSGVYV